MYHSFFDFFDFLVSIVRSIPSFTHSAWAVGRSCMPDCRVLVRPRCWFGTGVAEMLLDRCAREIRRACNACRWKQSRCPSPSPLAQVRGPRLLDLVGQTSARITRCVHGSSNDSIFLVTLMQLYTECELSSHDQGPASDVVSMTSMMAPYVPPAVRKKARTKRKMLSASSARRRQLRRRSGEA